MHKIIGYCPHCGAPLYVLENEYSTAEKFPPDIIYSCDCRLNLVPKTYPVYPQPIPSWPVYPTWPGKIWTTTTSDGTDGMNLVASFTVT